MGRWGEGGIQNFEQIKKNCSFDIYICTCNWGTVQRKSVALSIKTVRLQINRTFAGEKTLTGCSWGRAFIQLQCYLERSINQTINVCCPQKEHLDKGKTKKEFWNILRGELFVRFIDVRYGKEVQQQKIGRLCLITHSVLCTVGCMVFLPMHSTLELFAPTFA